MTDTIISRSVDVLLAIPYLLLATGLAAACTLGDPKDPSQSGCFGGAIQPGVGVVIFVISFTSWTYMARIVRGQTLSLREKEFVEASRAAGASNSRIIFREILPNLTAPIVVYASILDPAGDPVRGGALVPGRRRQRPAELGPDDLRRLDPFFTDAWWYMFFPGMALLLTVLAFNLIGDAMQDALNPKTEAELT